jgi:hypothetical protein
MRRFYRLLQGISDGESGYAADTKLGQEGGEDFNQIQSNKEGARAI